MSRIVRSRKDRSVSQRSFRLFAGAVLLILTLVSLVVTRYGTQHAQAAGTSPIKHIFIVVNENTPACAIYNTGAGSCPNTSADFKYIQGTLMHDPQATYGTNFIVNGGLSGEAPHSSAANFVRMEGGSDFGVMSACNGDPCASQFAKTGSTPHFTTLFKQNNISWTRYVGGNAFTKCPTNSTTDNGAGNYSGDHNGPIYWSDFYNDSTYCNAHYKFVASSLNDPNLQKDLDNDTVPQFAFIQPDNVNAGESPPTTRYATGDAYWQNVIGKIKASKAYSSSVIFAFYDETGHCSSGCGALDYGDPKTGLFVISPFISKAGANGQAVNIDTLVKTWQRMLGVTSPWLGKVTATMPDLESWFNVPIDGGACTTSCGTADNPPTVSLTAPANGASVATGASVSLAATASDDKGVAKVDFKVDGTLVTSDTTSPYTATWTAPNSAGSHTITVTATDTAGQIATSSVTITVGTAACTVAVAAPAYGSVTQQVTVTAGTYKVWSRIQVADTTNNAYGLVIGNPCIFNQAISTTTTGSWVWVAAPANVTLPDGPVAVTMNGTKNNVNLDRVLLVADLACVPTGAGDNCVPNPVADNTPPSVSVSATPTTVNVGATVNLSATATDNVGVTKVEFYVDGTLQSTSTGIPYSYAWSTNGAATGTHSLTAKAYDAAGNVATSSAVTVTVNAQTVGNGDANGDGRINQIDYSLWFNQDTRADVNKNGSVDASDLAIMLSNWTF